MSNVMRIVILICGLTFTAVILYLLIIKKMNEKNSVVWIVGSFSILGISAMPQILDKIAVLIGVYYPPSLLFLVSTLVLLVCILYYSIQISVLQEKIKTLAQQDAVNRLIFDKKIDEIEKILHQNSEMKKNEES
ncbi:MAG: DUF2304 domain-containing protein [Saccharofermentanales bacterium]